MAKKRMTKRRKVNRAVTISLAIASVLTIILLKLLKIIPTKFFVTIIILLLIINLILCYFIHRKGKKRTVAIAISVILTIIMVIGFFYEIPTIRFFKGVGKNNFKTVTYELIVLNDSSYDDLDDLEDKEIGLLDADDSDYELAIKKLKDKLSFDETFYSKNKLPNALLDEKVDAIMLEQSANKILKESNEIYASLTKVIYTFEIEVEINDIVKRVDVTKESFNIYISGIDTYGSITSVSRSDVNIVVSINPDTRKMIITSIPRDYYVTLPNKKGYKDKLTHAGIYGIEESVLAVEELLDIDINYYIKVNFTSLIDIVDALDGITVYSDYEFTTKAYDEYTKPYTFYKGKNNLNGKEALAFSRERKAFIAGDRTRNKNQQIVLKAMINKMLSPSILGNYNSLLKSLSKAFITNMNEDEITDMIKQELDLREDWDIDSYVLDGDDYYDYTYSYQSAKSYVMLPKEESVKTAKEKINKVLDN